MKGKQLLIIGFIAVISMAFCQTAFAKEFIQAMSIRGATD
jgi:hypothetical protein